MRHIRRHGDVMTLARERMPGRDLVWGDYDLCFPIADLYDGRV